NIYEGAPFIKLDFTGVSNGFALGSGAAYKTTDGGATWQSLAIENIGSALYFIDESTGFISGIHSIYKTTDGGASWQTIDIEPRSFLDYHFISATTGVATAKDFSDNQSLWRTTDGGATWKSVWDDYHFSLTTVFFLNEETGWAAGYYDQGGSTHEPVILKSNDGGTTWESIYHNYEVMGLGESFTDLRFKNAQEGFAVSELFVNVVTLDGGVTWNRADEDDAFSFPEFDCYYRSLAGYNNLFLTGTNGYLAIWK
ncbi:MAG: YCF48-related protein, partial [Chitinophagales bacterium]